MGLPGSVQRGRGYHKRFDMIVAHAFTSQPGVGGSDISTKKIHDSSNRPRISRLLVTNFQLHV